MTEPTAIEFEVRAAAASHTGLVREENQDACLVREPVFAVADGMGGHRSGRQAADAVAEAFRTAPWGRWATSQVLLRAAAAAGHGVRRLAIGEGQAPGSTLSGVALAEADGVPSWLAFNLGDSRTYLLRGESIEQVTVDHSERQVLLERGLTSQEIAARTDGNGITRAVGAGLLGDPDPDQWLVPAEQEDRILVCTDGLTGELSDALITALLMAYPDPAEAAEELVGAAVRSGGRDNVTAVVVDAVRVRGAAGAAPVDPDDTVEQPHGPLGGDTRPQPVMT